MLFHSIAFMIFLTIVFIIYWGIPHKFRWFLLLLSSYYFYMSWNAIDIVLILFTTILSYGAAILIEKRQKKAEKKGILVVSCALCLGILFFFKYFSFFFNSIVSCFPLFAWQVPFAIKKVVLPVGISFYTFQTLSYVVDIYRGKERAEHHFGIYASFISFFPQLVAGPIERTGNLLPQIKKEQKFDYEKATYGLKLMAWGFFKKLAIADVLAVYVDKVYAKPQGFQGFSLLLATLFFTIQIYCDFSGYSDIAIGTAKLMGIDLMTNFKSPYFSASIKEFWGRWHISLSTWFRDYVYIPLGGNRVNNIRHAVNLILTFLVSGLWHGANWTFVLWGGIHGIAQVIENSLWGKRERIVKVRGFVWLIQVGVIFCFCVIAWIFFRASSISDAKYVITHLFFGIDNMYQYLKMGFYQIGFTEWKLFKAMVCCILLLVYDFCSLKRDVIEWVSGQSVFVRWTIYFVFIWFILFHMQTSNQSEFIYFQF